MSEASPVGSATPPTDGGPRLTPRRPPVKVHTWDVGWPGFGPDDRYVRRWWTCAIGPSAVVDLLRMARHAADGAAIVPAPPTLPRLVAAGLVLRFGDDVVVPLPIRPVRPPLDRRIPPHLRASHAADLRRLEPPAA